LNLKLQYPEAGIGVDDSLDEATQKVEDYLKTQPEERDLTTQIIGSATTGYQLITIDRKTGEIVRREPIAGPAAPAEERQLTDEQIRATIRGFVRDLRATKPDISNDELKQIVMDDITLSDMTLADKERARLIANEMLGTPQQTTVAPEKKEETKPFAVGLIRGTAKVVEKVGEISDSFWQRLFRF